MAYSTTSSSPVMGQPIATTSTTQLHPLGKVIEGEDPTYGSATFIYLKGVASTAVGDLVIYDTKLGTTTRAVAGSRGPAAVAMSANVANQYGWYQVVGSAVVKSGTVAANAPLYVTATAGQVDDAAVAGDKIDGAISKTADGTPSAGFLVAQISWPSLTASA